MMKNFKYNFLIFGVLALSACSNQDQSVEEYVAEVKKDKPGKIDVLPPEKNYQSMDFTADRYLSPFEKGIINGDY